MKVVDTRVTDVDELVQTVFSGLSALDIEDVVDEGERVVVLARTAHKTWRMSPRWEPTPDICTGRHVAHTLHAHLVFVTNYRDVFDDDMLKRCEEIMREVCAGFDVELNEFNGDRDRVHLLVYYPPKVTLSKLINSLKGVSSQYLRPQYTGPVNRIGIGSVFGPAHTSPGPAAERH